MLEIAERTVYFALIPLITHPTHQLGNTLFPVQADRDRLIVVAE